MFAIKYMFAFKFGPKASETGLRIFKFLWKEMLFILSSLNNFSATRGQHKHVASTTLTYYYLLTPLFVITYLSLSPQISARKTQLQFYVSLLLPNLCGDN